MNTHLASLQCVLRATGLFSPAFDGICSFLPTSLGLCLHHGEQVHLDPTLGVDVVCGDLARALPLGPTPSPAGLLPPLKGTPLTNLCPPAPPHSRASLPQAPLLEARSYFCKDKDSPW